VDPVRYYGYTRSVPSDLVPALSVRHTAFEAAARAVIAGRRSPCTRAAYSSDLELWLTFAYARGIAPEAPAPEDVQEFKGVLLASLAPMSARRVLAGLSATFRRLAARGAAPGNPFHPDLAEWPAVDPEGKTEPVAPGAAEAMIAAARAAGAAAARDLAVLLILHETGLRRSSVASLRRDALFKRGDLLCARTTVKGGKSGVATFPEETTAALRAWLEVAPASPYAFPAPRDHTRPLHPNRVNDVVSRWARAAGVETHPHAFRVSFITEGYDQKLPERELQAAADHADPRTTQRYDRKRRGGDVATAIAAARKARE